MLRPVLLLYSLHCSCCLYANGSVCLLRWLHKADYFIRETSDGPGIYTVVVKRSQTCNTSGNAQSLPLGMKRECLLRRRTCDGAHDENRHMAK